MNRKNKKGMPSKSESMTQQALLLGAISDSQRTITGVNEILTSTVSKDYVEAVTHIALPTEGITDNGSNLIDPALEDVINAFSSAKGYTSSVTPSIIRGHIEQVTKAVEALLVLKRSQDGKELTDTQGNGLAEVLYSVPASGRQYATASGGFDASSAFAGVTELGTSSISNSVWANTYLAELGKLVIPRKLFKLLESFYSGVYRNYDASIDAYYSFWPVSIVGTSALTTPETVFSNALSTIDSNLATYPDLRSIIGILGIDSKPCLEYDWNRDVKGQSILVFEDPLIGTFFKNEFLSYAGFDEFDVPQNIQDTVELPFVRGNFLNREDQFALTADMSIYLGYFRALTTSPALLQSSFMQVDGDIAHYKSIGATRITFNAAVTALSSTGESRINHLGEAQMMSSHVIPRQDTMFIDAQCTNNDCDAFILSAASTNAFNGYNRMHLPEADHDVLNNMYTTELLFGSDYRENLRAIAASVSANIKIG